MDGVIDVNSDITSNAIWTADNTYHVLNAIDVNGALLAIEPGTVVAFAAGVNAGIRIVNGGALISVGRPNEPVIYTSDAVSPWYNDYYCAIYIEESASVCTKVAYSYIEYAYAGIVVMNKRLDVSIENNLLFHNIYGIVEYGTEHTDVSNNLIFRSYTSGIEVWLESYGGQADANSQILIENNTCDYYQDDGIYVHGTEDANDAGFVVLANNIVSGSYQFGLHLCDPCEWIVAVVTNTGYYDNYYNKNWAFEEDDPVIESANPYREGSGWMPYWYVGQDCNFIDAGYSYVEETGLIGKTTDVNSEPDRNYVDIGFHYPNWDFSNAGDGNSLESDFNRDLIVNFADFAVLADGWETSYDMNDLAALAGEWLDVVSAHPNISVTVSGDPCNLSGDVTVGVDGIAYATEGGFIYVDGQVTEIIDYTAEEGYTILDSFAFRNGTHEIKAVTVDANGLITLSENTTVNFNNVIHCVAASESFGEGQDYRISGLTASSNDFRVKVVDWAEEATLWTSPALSGQLKVAIPAGVLDGPIFDLQIEENTTVESESWEERWKRGIGKEYVPGTLYKFGVFLPRGRNHFGRSSSECRKKAVAEIVRVCEGKSWPYVVLYRGECNWGNFSDVLSQTSIKYVYLVCHGGTHVREGQNTVQRTNFKISSRGWFGCDRVVSYKGGLPGKMETSSRVHSMASLGLGTRTQIRLAQVDGCVQTEYQDMARRWINFDEQPILEQLYSGYKSSCKDFHPDWQKWSYDLWNELSESSTTYWDAFQEIQKPQNNESGFEISQAVQWYGWDQITLE